MKSKLSTNSRLKLIGEILQGKVISKVAEEAGVSKTLLHKWLRRYKERGEEGLKALTPGRPRKSRTPKKLGSPKPLSSLERLRMVQEVLDEGKSASDVAKKYGVSRITLYKWVNRFKEAPDKRLAAVEDKKREVFHYFRQTPEKYEQVVLNLVSQHPEYGIRKLLQEVPKIGGRPIIGHHGIQNVLTRHSLATYEQRLAYAQSQITPVTRVITRFLGFTSRFFAIPQIPRNRIVRFGSIAALSMFVTVVVFGLGSFLATSYVSAPLSTRIGLVFATSALIFGSIFFLYSLKYYISLAIVLSFSQSESAGNIEQRTKGRGFLSWILGLGRGKVEMRKRIIGLEPNLEHITLKRYPKISVHIPLYNEKNVVERLLSSVTSFDYPGDYEVIIADDSTDETTQIIQEYLNSSRQNVASSMREKDSPHATSYQLHTTKGDGWTLTEVEIKPGVVLKHLHRTSRQGFKGGALREALRVTDPKAEFVSVFDADFVPYPDTLELFLKYFQATAGSLDFAKHTLMKTNVKRMDTNERISSLAPDSLEPEGRISSNSRIAAVQGYQWHVLNKSENWITRGVRSEYAGSYVIERSGAEIYTGLKQISGSVYMIRRDILEETGWGTSITEDFQLTLRLYEKGYKVVYTPYIQAPAECVSTLKRLIRQRMRWAEGHSNNIRRMFWRLMFGRWEETLSNSKLVNSNSGKTPITNYDLPITKERRFVKSPLTLSEKLEFLYLSPYYLQAFFFLVGTISWLISEAIFPARLPFWTSIWGWSLVLTNMLSLPLMNAVGLFLEESEERDYLGLASFVALSYILVPFQAYAAVKGFIQKEEGPWFRTPKTGKITDIFTRGKFYRFISGILPGRASPAVARMQANSASGLKLMEANSPYLGLATANSRFDSFNIKPKGYRFIGNLVLIFALISSFALSYHGAKIKTGQLSDLPIQTRVEKVGEDGSFLTSLFGIFSAKEAMAATEKAQKVFVSSVKQVSLGTLFALSALVLLFILALLIHLYKKKRRFFKKAVKLVLVFSLILSWLLSGWPAIWKNPRFPPKIREAYAQTTYTAESLTTSSTTLTTLQNKVTLNFTPGATAEHWVVVATGEVRNTGTTADSSAGNVLGRFALSLDGTVIPVTPFAGYAGSGSGVTGGNHTAWKSFTIFKKITGFNTQRTAIVQWRSDAGVATEIRNARLLAFRIPNEASANIQYVEALSLVNDTVNPTSALTLTFTPSSQGDYVLMGQGFHHEGPGGASTGGLFWVDEGTEVTNTNETYINQDEPGVPFFHVQRKNLTAASHTFILRHKPDITSGTPGSERFGLAILAFRADVFDNTETSEALTQTTTTSTTYQNKINFTVATAASARDHVFLGGHTPGHATSDTNDGRYGRWLLNGVEITEEAPAQTRNIYNKRQGLAWMLNTVGGIAVQAQFRSPDGVITASDEEARLVVLRYPAPAFNQSAYRWFNNANSTNVGTSLANQDTPFSQAVAQGTPFRLRLLLHVSNAQLPTSGENFKLQIAQRSGTCDTGFSGETYADLSPSSGAIRYYNNTTPADGAALTANANDPTHSTDTIRNQTYEEANNFTNSQVAIGVSQDGKWDFAMVDFSAAQNTTYCLRVVKSDATTLTTYTVIPEFTTVPENPILLLGLYPLLMGVLKKFRRGKNGRK